MGALNGGLFTNDFLTGSIIELDEWQALTDASLDTIKHSLREILDRFPTGQSPNESQTEDDGRLPSHGRLQVEGQSDGNAHAV